MFMTLKHLNIKAGRRGKYEFHKLEPGTFLEIDFVSRRQVHSISSCLQQYIRKNNLQWKAGIRTVEGKVRVIRWS